MRSPDLDEVPEELARTAFRNGSEMAWKRNDCKAAIEWLRSVGRAVLGTELWRVDGNKIRAAIATRAGPAIYSTTYEPLQNERWNDYVERSAALAIASIASFHWPEDSTEPPSLVYFNITWADRAWFREHSHAKFANDQDQAKA
jgi:hypothetical protein